MRAAHTVAQVRAAEERALAALPEGALMQRAAAGLAVAVADFLGSVRGRRVLLLVGSGDNGGDALHAGARLARRGAVVTALPLGERLHAGGREALLAAGGRLVSLPDALRPRPDVVVDGIVGIGGAGALRPAAAAAVAALGAVPVVAVDVPSGVEVDSGEVTGPHVRAALTVTFGTHKVAHLADPAAAACGTVHLVDLDLDLPEADVTALQTDDVARLLPWPAADSHKYTRGVLGLRAGSTTYPGAAVLVAAGAVAGPLGMVRYVGPDAVGAQVRAAFPEVVGDGRVQAWAVGSGTADRAAAELAETLARAAEEGLPVVVDADALHHLPEPTGPRRGAVPLVLTPHAGELAAMTGADRAAIEAAPLRHAREAARRWQAVVLLKGRRTVVARPDGTVRVTTTGTPWLATAGAGDVLTGLVGALLAAGLEPFDAASVGSWLHGAAARTASTDAAGGPLRAGDVARAIPRTLGSLRHGMGHSEA